MNRIRSLRIRFVAVFGWVWAVQGLIADIIRRPWHLLLHPFMTLSGPISRSEVVHEQAPRHGHPAGQE